MNYKFCEIRTGHKPAGYKHISPEVFAVIHDIKNAMMYETPLMNYDSISVSIDIIYHDFIPDWWKMKPNYERMGLKPRITIIGKYFFVPEYDGTDMVELTDFGWMFEIYPKTSDILFQWARYPYPTGTTLPFMINRVVDINYKLWVEYHDSLMMNDVRIKQNKIKEMRKKHRKRVKAGEGTGEMKRGYTDFCRATFMYDDGSTKVVYKHSPTSYTIENITGDGSTYIIVDGPNATDEIFKMIMSFYKNHKGHIKRHKD